MSEEKDFMKNFGMIIPAEAYKTPIIVEDERGAPIYADCPAKGGWCACTGACLVIIEYTKDPEKLAAHREYIKKYNEFLTRKLITPTVSGNGIRVWSNGENKKDDQKETTTE